LFALKQGMENYRRSRQESRRTPILLSGEANIMEEAAICICILFGSDRVGLECRLSGSDEACAARRECLFYGSRERIPSIGQVKTVQNLQHIFTWNIIRRRRFCCLLVPKFLTATMDHIECLNTIYED
jgi:hypothetical protein